MASESISSPSIDVMFEIMSTADIASFVDDSRQEDLTLDFKPAPKAFDTADERKVQAAVGCDFWSRS